MPLSSSKSSQANASRENCGVFTVPEVARLLGVTDTHIRNLIEERELLAVDISGGGGSFPIPKAALPKLAARINVTPDQLAEFIRTLKPADKSRAMWRIPHEAYTAFMAKRSSKTIL